MIRFYFTMTLLCLSSHFILAQTQDVPNSMADYRQKLLAGDEALRNGQFKLAIDKYDAAEAYDPHRKDVIRKRVKKVLEAVEELAEKAKANADAARRSETEAKNARIRAEQSEIRLQELVDSLDDSNKKLESARLHISRSLVITEEAELKSRLALEKARKLTEAFYFYAGRFALAFREGQFYFIDKNGQRVENISKEGWDKATQFDRRGLAQVWRSGESFLLDTFGQEYPVAYQLKDITPHTKALDLSGQSYQKIPRKVFAQRGLEILLLNDNQIETLPAQIQLLSELRYLDLSKNNLIDFPPSLGKLEGLRSLFLSQNQLKFIPTSIFGLEDITELDLSYNKIRRLPNELEQISGLKTLLLRNNAIVTLPDSIHKFANLEVLDLRANKLHDLPKGFDKLINLRHIDLGKNKLQTLPAIFGELTTLRTICLNGNDLRGLPIELSNLKSARLLDLRNNENLQQCRSLDAIKQNMLACIIYFDGYEGEENYWLKAEQAIAAEKYEIAIMAYEAEYKKCNTILAIKQIVICHRMLRNYSSATSYLE